MPYIANLVICVVLIMVCILQLLMSSIQAKRKCTLLMQENARITRENTALVLKNFLMERDLEKKTLQLQEKDLQKPTTHVGHIFVEIDAGDGSFLPSMIVRVNEEYHIAKNNGTNMYPRISIPVDGVVDVELLKDMNDTKGLKASNVHPGQTVYFKTGSIPISTPRVHVGGEIVEQHH